MTKKDLAEKFSLEFNTSKVEAEKMVGYVFDEVVSTLAKKDEVSIAGFGKFLTSERAEREGINPSTKEKIRIPATTVAKFKPAKQLKEIVAK